jgi:hypothetical protein
MTRVAVLFDRFCLGGRETYVAEVIAELRERTGLKCGLISKQIVDWRATEVFHYKIDIGSEGHFFYQNAGVRKVFEALEPQLLWAQHCELIEGLVLSSWYDIPLLPTFHTPFKKGTTWNDPVLNLGVAFAVNRCPLVAGVSDEILRSLAHLGVDDSKLRLLPNRVQIIGERGERPASPYVRVVALARLAKRDHIRAAVRFFHALRSVRPTAQMSIYCGEKWQYDNCRRGDILSKLAVAGRTLGRKWLAKNYWCLRDLPAITFCPQTEDARAVIRDADVVLGMGRVLLEALSLGKIAILVGYQDVIGRVSMTNFQQLRSTNLSGREMAPLLITEVVAQTVESLRARYCTPPSILREIDLSVHWEDYAGIFAEVVEKWKSNELNQSLSAVDVFRKNCLDNCKMSTDYWLRIANNKELEMYRKLNDLSSAPPIVC